MKAALRLLLLLCITWTAQAEEEPILNIYNWADYIDPSLIDEFEEEFGIKVNYDTYDSAAMVDTKLLTGKSGYDLVMHAAANSARLIPIGVYQPVDFSKLKNSDNIDPAIMVTMRDAFGVDVIGVPYSWGTTGFTYNVDMIMERMPDAPLESGALMFDPEVVSKFADCGVTLLDSATTVIPMALVYLGLPAGSVDPEHLAQAEELLSAIRPYIKYFDSAKMLLDMPSKEVCLAMSWSGDYGVASTRAKEAGVEINLDYSVPVEGATSWYDVIYIPADARHPNNAHLFLDFILRPEVIARVTNFTGYANVNLLADEFVDPEILNDPAIYPDQATRDRLHPVAMHGPKEERLRSRSWTKIKSGL